MAIRPDCASILVHKSQPDMRCLGSHIAVLAISCVLGACSSSGAPDLASGLPAAPQQSSAPPETASGPSLPDLSALTKGAALPVGTPTEVYTRVARGALNCWFGASGPLKGPYIYHADADPPSKGGKAEIDIRVRDPEARDPRSLKAFEVNIAAGGEGTKVEIQNDKIPEPLATRLTADVRRWAAGEEGCGEVPVTAGWSAQQPAPATSKSAKTKPAAKSAVVAKP